MHLFVRSNLHCRKMKYGIFLETMVSKLSVATHPPIIQSHYRQLGTCHCYKYKVNLIARERILLLNVLQDLHFSLYRVGREICGGEGGEIGNIKTKNGQYLFPVVWRTN